MLALICVILDSTTQSKEDLDWKDERSLADRTQPSSVLQSSFMSTQPKSIPSSAAIMRNRMAFFSVPSQPVRINARAFLGLESTPFTKPAEEGTQVEVKDISEKVLEKEEKVVEVATEEKSPGSAKESEANRKRHGRREPTERAKRWRKRRKKRCVTGHVTGSAVAEKHAALLVVSIDGASSDEDEDEDKNVDLATVGYDVGDRVQEYETENVTGAGDVDEVKDTVENAEELETEPYAGANKSLTSQDEVVLLEDKHQQSEITGGVDSAEEATVTVCNAADDLSETGSEIVDELCMSADDDSDDDTNDKEYLADGRTINYDRYFAEEPEIREDSEDNLCHEEQQQVVDNIESSFREIGDAQPPTNVTDLPLTQSEERLLMFGWKDGIEGQNGLESVEKDVNETVEVIQDSGKEITLGGKDDRVSMPVSAAHDSARSSASSSPSEHKHSYQPLSKSSDQTAVAQRPAEKLAPRAEVDSFSDEDLELCVEIPSYHQALVGVTSDVTDEPVVNQVPTEAVNVCDENQNLETSSNFDSVLTANTGDSANLSDIVLANISSHACQPAMFDTSNTNSDVKFPAQVFMQSLPQNSNGKSFELSEDVKTNTVLSYIEETDSVEKKEDLRGVTSPAIPRSPVSPLSADSSKLAKLDPVARIDLLLESLSASRVSPLSPSLLAAHDDFVSSRQQSGKPEISLDFPKLQHSVSPSSRLDKLADTSVSSHTADTSNVRDESRIVEFKVEDECGAEHSFRVDESFVSMRDKRQHEFSEKESLSDISFSATDSAADQSITCRNADESSSSGTHEVATCPAALMATTDDSLSLDCLASFSFDDVLSSDNILDGENDSQDLADLEGLPETKDPNMSAKPVCNGTLHDEIDSMCKQQRNELHATVVDAPTGKDSPPVAVVSPSRLVDAKRRFFCEPPQPVRIDPRRVFDEIPAAASVTKGASTDQTSTSISSNTPQQVNGLTSKAPATVENLSSDTSSSDQPRRRVLPALPSDQPQLDVSQLVSAEEFALIKKTQQRETESGEKNVTKSAQLPVTVDDASIFRRRPHRSEKKRPSSALIVTATEQEMGSSGWSSIVGRPSPQTPSSSTAKPSAILKRQSSHSDSTTDGSPGQRRERLWAFHRPKSKTKVANDLASSGDMENSGGSDRKDKRRSLLALLMPSKNLDRREKVSKDLPPVNPEPSAADATAAEPSVDRTEMIAAIREKTKSLPLEKKKLPASDAVKRSSLEKQRSKSSKTRGSKKSEGEGDGRSKPTQRTVYEEMVPIIEGIKRVERRNREKVNIHDRIRAVAPPPAKAPFTALLPPKADSKC